MADEKKTYLVNVESNLKKYADEAAEAKKKVDELRAANDLLKESGKASASEIEASNAAVKNATAEYTKAQKMVQLQVAANSSETGSRKQLSEILNLQMQELGKLSDAYILNAEGQRELNPLYIEQRKRITETKQAIIDYDLALNDGRSNVGRYGESVNIAMKEAGRNIVSLFPSLRPVISGIESVQRSIKATGENATISFKAIKAGIASTGIGLLVIAVTALVALFGKLGIGKTIMDKITDAIGLTTIAQDKLAEAQRKSNEASIAGLENELTLIKAKNSTIDEIFQKELELARLNFETEKATLVAYAYSKKNFDLAAKGGEQDLKVQAAKTAYFALLSIQNRKVYDDNTKYINELSLLKKKDLDKDLEAIEQWYAAESAKYPNSYALYLLYEEKKKQARLKYAAEPTDELQNLKNKNTEQALLLQSLLKQEYDYYLKSDEYANDSQDKRLIANKQYTDATAALAKLRIEQNAAEARAYGNLAGSISDLLGRQTAAGKAFAVASAIMNTYSGATLALNDETIPSTALRLIAAATVIVEGLANVKQILAVNTSGGSSTSQSAPRTITRNVAPTVNQGTTILTQPIVNQTQSTAIQSQNAMNYNDLVAALKQMPAPRVSVEDINVRMQEVDKVKVRANI